MKVLKVSNTASGDGFWVTDEKKITARNEEETIDLHERGKKSKKVGDNGINKESSSSHCILVLKIHQKSQSGQRTASKLLFVDLAGSERREEVKQDPKALAENKQINSTLSALMVTVKKLSSSHSDISYTQLQSYFRGKKLTKLLS